MEMENIYIIKKYDILNSFEGKSNKSGIRFKDNTITWK